MSFEPRSRTTRALAESALVKLVEAIGAESEQLVVVGGLVPEYLAQDSPVEHQGTADVDVVLSVGFAYDRDELDFAWLEEGLRDASFEVDRKTPGGWRWTTQIDGQLIKIEFLCDVAGDFANRVIALPGCSELGASNMKGPGAAIKDHLTISLSSDERDSSGVNVQVAALGGYILAKAAAAANRGFDRDFYDFVYVLIFNDLGGPEAAAAAVRSCAEKVQDAISSYEMVYLPMLREAIAAMVGGNREGARAYAIERQRTGATDALEVLVEDAVSASLEFINALAGEPWAGA